MTAQKSNTAAVAELYDSYSELHSQLFGDNLHVGYWHDEHDPASFEEAAEQLTDQMIQRLNPQPGQRVLDIGCGLGQPALRLARSHDVTVVGISISRHQVESATARARRLGLADRVTFHCVDIMDLPYPDASFDAAWFFESLIHMPDKAGALRQAARVLRPGSRLLLADMFHQPGQDWSAAHRALVTSIGLDEYRQLLTGEGLTVLAIEDVTPHFVMPEAVRVATRAKVLERREEWVRVAGEALVREVIDSEDSAFTTAGVGYVLVTADRRRCA